MKLYQVKVERVQVWKFVVRASTTMAAGCLADELAAGTYPNYDFSDDTTATEIEDEGQEVDGEEGT